MPNQLAQETSPYLLQHANNPVNWLPWGKEAFDKALSEDKPVFLSIGYAACHWCHVMAHESFEDPAVADLLNQHFVSIKVDREERPDVDSVYMNAVVTMTGQGGWPMSVFLTPQGEPFYGGTYFPPQPRHGLPAFSEVLLAASRAWQENQGEIRKTGSQLAAHLTAFSNWGAETSETLRTNLLEQSTQSLLNAYDWQFGGWGHAPRFPQPMSLEFLLLQSTRGNQKALDAAVHNLTLMDRGGMYDVVGGGFSRYSTDDRWLVPHFEKMLYDNAQLALVYLHAGLLSGSQALLATCTQTLDFILSELTHPTGGFFSSLDADFEGEEGKYYAWSLTELRSILAEEFDWFRQIYDLPKANDFDGDILLRRRASLPDLAAALEISEDELAKQLDRLQQRLYEVRAARVRPATDDKILVSWNGLALRAFAEAARYLDRADYLAAAQKNADFLLNEMLSGGRLFRAWRDGKARHPGFLEDYASLIIGLLALYQSDSDLHWYHSAAELAKTMLVFFKDEQGGFFDTPADLDDLFTRPKDYQDNATPSGNALAAYALLQLAEFGGAENYRSIALGVLATLQDGFVKQPTAFGMWLQVVDFAAGPVNQVALIEPDSLSDGNPVMTKLWSRFRPRLVAARSAYPPPAGAPALFVDRSPLQGKTTAFVCQGFVCKLPVTEAKGLEEQLESI